MCMCVCVCMCVYCVCTCVYCVCTCVYVSHLLADSESTCHSDVDMTMDSIGQ